MPLQHDLHAHSTESDGSLSPRQLVKRAAGQGVEVLALTDHDTLDGLAEAHTAAGESRITLIPGVEISVTWCRCTVHVLGLNVNPNNNSLRAGLQELRQFRDGRAEEIGRRLEKAGISGAYEGAKAFARAQIIGRTHFARFLVEQGHAKNLRSVFKKFLVPNKPGHVCGQWADLDAAVAWITDAGGQAVVAHPARYSMTATKLKELLGEFLDCGGVGLEVVSGSHSNDDMYRMATLAKQFGLYASRGSDYHGPEHPWIELGRMPELPGTVKPIWESEQWQLQHALTSNLNRVIDSPAA